MGLIPRAWLRHVQGSGHLEWEADERLAECLEHNAPFPDDLARVSRACSSSAWQATVS
jgi:hypothetical protein